MSGKCLEDWTTFVYLLLKITSFPNLLSRGYSELASMRLSPGRVLLTIWILGILIGSDAKDRYSKKYGSQRSYYNRASSLSKGKLKSLFPTAAALGGIYIASRMRPRIHLRSYHDLYQYTVCEGRHVEVSSLSGDIRTYSHFLCPDDPNQPFERYCCWDKLRGSGVCCSYDEKVRYYTYSKWGLLGGAICVICVAVFVGLLVYCLCCRRRRSPGTPPPVPVYTPRPPGAYTGPPTKPAYPGTVTPYPTGPGGPTFPSPQHAPPSVLPSAPQPGSGWGAPVANTPGSGWTDIPPPPYSAVQQYTNQMPAPPPSQ
ncbi:hypothetical protein CRM22_006794 [Opisthorchis felineus]|uniref:Uncharacterized protein n=2 Tax=Opisthorchis felineus TaxID=147828 RepID=A0A4S2LJ56_OPIFE|nr:hypothetical protein CRM22_006794 [Opisthorchis felineus]TGZ63646.1 hypothetical protein CRM22_006794 [Opisthorchis felineus]TGZ63647.1 hypothetical protein CRM22_006794 [Opisthorchis felineus]